MKKYVVAAAIVLAASSSEAQQLVVEWTPGTCPGYCLPTAGYAVYLDDSRIDVGVGTASGSDLKATIDLGAIPTGDIMVSMTSYDATNVESIRSNAVMVAAQEWLQGTPVPVVVRVRPLVKKP